ncbi:SUKH-4 family immunity protein [Glycomyces terrestris]|uniref:SUKH-4 family immunity protein n=1 Tax=Glycomyces terrestris TaxID=2493553 RepID=A0A426UW01_9ACTN|nr:SUKH-4 family immunity protein [Glycomyces terrestris]RRR98388.1 hypothetical protein EIW28_15960 [Glycomyces terrestris]
MTDEQIAAALAGRAATPYPGEWQSPPFRDRREGGRVFAVVAIDPGLSEIGVDRDGGGVYLLGEEPVLVNASAAAFTACSQVYAAASAEADRLEAAAEAIAADDDVDDDEEEDRGDAFTEVVLARLAAADPAAVADENAFWSIAAEELGYRIP